MVRQGLVRSAIILTICGVLCKVLGAVYRVPLTAILGASGMGVYYLIFPIYSFMLSLSSASLPAALSKLVAGRLAQKDSLGAKKYFRCSLVLFFFFGLICTTFVVFSAPLISAIQHNSQNIYSYLLIAPAILFVCLISCFRGYFQGYQNMTYSGVSQIVEQVVKIGLGLFLTAKLVPYGLNYGVMGSIIAITVSELVALGYLYIAYVATKKKLTNEDIVITTTAPAKYYYKELIKTALPFTLGYIIFPLATLIDSIMVVPLLTGAGISNDMAISIFGLNNAVVGTLTNLPIVVSTSLAMVVIPSITYNLKKQELDRAEEKINLIFKLAIIIILPCVVVFAVFAQDIIFAIFGNLGNTLFDEMFVGSNMLIISSIGVLYLTIFQLSTAVLQASGNYYAPVVSLGVGVGVKLCLTALLLSIEHINIYAVNIGSIICYMIITIINMHYFNKAFNIKIDYKRFLIVPIISSILMSIVIVGLKYILSLLVSSNIAIILSFIAGGAVYLGIIFIFKTFNKKELAMIAKKQ